jgi:penicillin-binding protein 1C
MFVPPALLFLVLRFSPYPALARYQSRPSGLVVEDRNGVVLRVIPAADGVKREWAGLDEIPPGAVAVFLRSEDRRFYFHPGVDPLAVLGSALRNLRAGRVVSGASTITMQLARLIRPHSRGMKGKIGEAWDALRLEARLSKRAILELWCNGIPFGSNVEGLPAMARFRFGLPVTRLDDAGAALLAAVPRNPSYYDPALNPEAAARAALLLSERLGLGLTAELLRDYAFAASAGGAAYERAPFYAPHFTERLGRELAGTGRRRVRSTLDLALQEYAEELLGAEIEKLSDNRVSNGAILLIENESGAVRAYVGSRSWFDDERSGKIDGVRVLNQPGSCLKPFLYALALDSGFTPADILPDIPSVFGTGEAYIPSNFNNRFNGPVRFRVSLASSLNIPAVYLLERLGVAAFETYLADLGFASVAARRGSHGVGLALGNAEVSLEELVSAFAAFPAGGVPAPLRFIEDTDSTAGTPVMSPWAAWIIADILSDRASRFTGFGPAPALATAFPSLFKTGTANQYQHIWALGATRHYTVGVWMGNFSGETVVGRTGSSIPARIAADLLTFLESREGQNSNTVDEYAGGPPPAGIETAEICALSGMPAGPFCPGTLREWLPGTAGAGGGARRPVTAEYSAQAEYSAKAEHPANSPQVCDWHQAGDTRSPLEAWSPSEPWYPPEYRSWLVERFRVGRAASGFSGGAYIRIPAEGSVFYLDPSQPADSQALRIETAGFGGEAFVYADGVLMGALNRAGVFVLPLTRGVHTVLVEDNHTGAGVTFTVR